MRRPFPKAIRRPRFSPGVQLYIAREVLRSFILIFLGFQVIVCCIFGIGAVRDFGVDMDFILPFLLPAVATNLNAAVPVSLLFATALVYGRLIADREVAALKSFGLSYRDLTFLPAALGGGLGVIILCLNFWVLPDLRFNKDSFGAIILQNLRSLGEGWNRSFNADDYTLWIERYQGSKLRGIFIGADKAASVGMRGVDREAARGAVSSRAYPFFLWAEEGEVVSDPGGGGKALLIELRGLSAYFDSDILRRGVATDFKHRVDLGKWQIPIEQPETVKKTRELPLGALLRRTEMLHRTWEEMAARGEPAEKWAKPLDLWRWAVVELQRRICFAIMVLTFPVAGACVALFLNSPNRLLPVFVSLMVVPSVYYVLEMWGNNMALHGHLPPLWPELGNLGLLALIVGLLLILRRRTLW